MINDRSVALLRMLAVSNVHILENETFELLGFVRGAAYPPLTKARIEALLSPFATEPIRPNRHRAVAGPRVDRRIQADRRAIKRLLDACPRRGRRRV